MFQQKNIYIETTIPSIVTSRPSRDIITVSRQNISKIFWEYECPKHNLYISEYVLDECSKGDKEAAKRRLDLIKGISLLEKTEEVEKLAEEYFRILNIPLKAKTDCSHLAIAVVYKMNYLVSWNMTHLGQVSYNEIIEYNKLNKLWLPKMVTPDVFMDMEREEEENGIS